MKTKIRATVVAACTLGLLSAATPALADATVVSVGDGTLLAKGAAVSIPVTYTCAVGESWSLDAQLSQKISQGRITKGGTQVGTNCTGANETVNLSISPEGQLAFKSGSGLLHVTVFSCGDQGCQFTSSDYTISIKNK